MVFFRVSCGKVGQFLVDSWWRLDESCIFSAFWDFAMPKHSVNRSEQQNFQIISKKWDSVYIIFMLGLARVFAAI